MSYTINSLDKRSGITYVYAVDSYWDKEKQQARSKRTLIGKLDPVTGEVIPTDGRGKKRIENLEKATAADATPLKTGPVPSMYRTNLYVLTYLRSDR